MVCMIIRNFEGEKGAKRNAQQQVAYLSELVNKYPIDSIEDGMDENDCRLANANLHARRKNASW